MALLPYPSFDALDPDVRARIERFENEHGRPSLLRRMLAWFPPALETIDVSYHPLMTRGRLPRWFKELLFAAASQERECFY